MSARALVTGSTGFIGGALTRRLVQDGWEVHSVVRPSSNPEAIAGLRNICQLHTHDGSTEQLLSIMREADPHVVFHLASLFLAEHQPVNVEDLIHSNVLFSTQLVEAMVRNDCKRLVNTGTSWQHYHTTDYRPVNLYAATKQAFEDILLYYHDAHQLSVITLKLLDTYGPDDRRGKFVNLLQHGAQSGETLRVSPGDQLIDVVHVEDVTRAFWMAADRLVSVGSSILEAYCVSSGRPISLRELVRSFQDAGALELEVEWDARPYRTREVMAPGCDRPWLPGWEPLVSLNQGLRQLVKGSG